MDYKLEYGNHKRCIFSEEQIQYIIELYKSNKSTVEIGKLFNTSHKVIGRLLEKYNIPRTGVSRRKYNLDETYFDEINTQNKAYILGFLFADGCNFPKKQTISLSLQEEDKYILEKMREELKSENSLKYKNYTNKHDGGYHYKNQYSLYIYSKHICDELAKYGMVPNKSLKLKFPNLPESLYPHFVRGYFDGDGSIVLSCKNDNISSVIISFTSTEDFCLSLQNIIKNKLNIFSSKIDDASCHNGITKVLHMSKKMDIKIFLDWLYNDAEMFLTRKYDKYIKSYYSIL